MITIAVLSAVICLGLVHSGTVGDGRTSLINGKPVDYRFGSCSVDGRTYASETSVPRDDPCHYCICYLGKVDCYWKKCANIPAGCQVMAFQEACNPSLYVCDIPERTRDAPAYKTHPSTTSISPAIGDYAGAQLSTTTAISSLSTSPAVATPPAGTIQFSLRPARQPVVTPSRELTPPEKQWIEPPSRHLMPPLKPQSRQLDDGKQPSQFGLRMKHKMRFSRSVDFASPLPHNIQEGFPLNFDDETVIRLVERHVRSKRSINGAGDNHHHHHHHDHEHEEDRGCTILGVRYELGEVIGVATDVCQECRCAAQSLFCSPKCCFKPAPLQLGGESIRFLLEQTSPIGAQDGPQHPLHYVESE